MTQGSDSEVGRGAPRGYFIGRRYRSDAEKLVWSEAKEWRMAPADLVLIALLLCLGVGVGCMIFAVVKGFKIDDGMHRGLFVTLISAVALSLLLAGIEVWLVAK